ncbi:hypothetical protein E7Z59_12720 [Robertkochia marina]|uniref:Uncharacterized protein n=1 Tax=Robertkochia marina TaxID=1227945 RepID=A0A4V3UY09_9FLAO|nr:hypothetical protein [Robertkochia marina]THD66644.1 hypothetical protein E7Z59_12720 [Robertkochia marina]
MLGTKVTYFDNNKKSLDSVFDENGVFKSGNVYSYNVTGLVEEIVKYDQQGDVMSVNRIVYENGDIIELQWSENAISGITTRIDKVSYTSSQIIVERFDENNNKTYELQYGLNADGMIYKQDNGQTQIEVIYMEGLPLSKTITTSSGTQTVAYDYLNDPLPKDPWITIRKNQFGSFNNQLIFHFDGGLFSMESIVDLKKYLSSYSGKQFLYEFDENQLPVRIEEINGTTKVIRVIKYKEKV